MTPDDAQGEHVAEQVRILCGAYADLLDGLADAAREMEGPGKLAAVERALGAVVRFVQGDANAFAAGAHLPLIALARAVNDLRAGSLPELFNVPPTANRPAGTAFGMARGQAAAAVAILEDAGMQPADAAAFVAAELARHGIVQPDGKTEGEAIAPSLVRRWRQDVRQGKAQRLSAQAFRAAFDAELQRRERHGHGDPGMPETIADAQGRAARLVASLAMWFGPSR